MAEEQYTLDASALLAMLHGEPGGDAVAMVISASAVSAVNWSEVLQKARAHDVETDGLREDLESVGLRIVEFGPPEAEAAADIWRTGGQRLSMADRACLATAVVRGLVVMTSDRAWASLELGVEVRLIR